MAKNLTPFECSAEDANLDAAMENWLMVPHLHLLTVYQDDYVKVETDNAARFLYAEWFLHPDSKTLWRNFKMLAELAVETKSLYWLSDARAIQYIEFADQNWLLNEIVPMLKISHLLKFARLTTTESLMLLDVTRVIDLVGKLTDLGVKTKLEQFTSKEAALAWLFAEA